MFPVLFAAGMSLVDMIDGVLMLRAYGAYEWAFVRPIRKLYYNLAITLVSVSVALLIGGIETLGLLADRFDLKGGLRDIVGTLNDNFNDNFNDLGVVTIIGVFVFAWVASFVIYRVRGYDDVRTHPAG